MRPATTHRMAAASHTLGRRRRSVRAGWIVADIGLGRGLRRALLARPGARSHPPVTLQSCDAPTWRTRGEDRLVAGAAEAALVAGGGIEDIHLVPAGARDRRQNGLGDPRAALDGERRVAGVQHDDLDLPAVVLVD